MGWNVEQSLLCIVLVWREVELDGSQGGDIRAYSVFGSPFQSTDDMLLYAELGPLGIWS